MQLEKKEENEENSFMSQNNLKEKSLQAPGFIRFIAYLQIIGIILVVVGHSFHQYPDGYNGFSLLFYRLCFSFRMPLFLFVSGFLMIYTTKINENPKIKPKKFIFNKIRRLLLPLLVLTLLTIIPRNLLSFAADDSFDIGLKNIFLSFAYKTYMPIPFFWFLHVSFILLTLSFTILYIGKKLKLKPSFLVGFLLILFTLYSLINVETTSLFSLSELKRLGLFFFLGALYGLFYKQVDAFISWTNPWILGMNALLWGFSFWMLEVSSLIIICSFFGILMCISIAKIIEYKNWGFLNHLKGANYLIFLLSWYFNIFSQQILAYYFDMPWWIHTSLSIIFGIYMPFLAYIYLKGNQHKKWVRITSYCLGQSFPNERKGNLAPEYGPKAHLSI